MLKKVEIQNRFDLEELTNRLKEVRLKCFKDVKIYENAKIKIEELTPDQIKNILYTPQPTVYRTFLDRIDQMAELFAEQGIDISKLNGGVDYIAHDENGEQTQWTLVPPVVEMIPIRFKGEGLDYSQLLSEELRKAMFEKGHVLNPELNSLWFEAFKKFYLIQDQVPPKVPIICDGSHRVHAAFEKGLEQTLLVIDGPKQGYPYYAAPKPYSVVKVEPERPPEGSKGKTHVLTEPGHKLLYRLFPTGGILSGTVRPGKS